MLSTSVEKKKKPKEIKSKKKKKCKKNTKLRKKIQELCAELDGMLLRVRGELWEKNAGIPQKRRKDIDQI